MQRLEADLAKANKERADLRHDLRLATGEAGVAFLQGAIDARTNRIKSIETGIASLRAKIPAADPGAPQSQSGHGKDVVDVLKTIIDSRGTIGSDELDASYRQMKVAILKTIDSGAPVELLWHWITKKESEKADKFINIPRTTEMSGDYLLLTRIKVPVSIQGDWALTIVLDDVVRRDIKSDTGPLKPNEDRPMNLLIPLGLDKDKAGHPSCAKGIPRVSLFSCNAFAGCLEDHGMATSKTVTYFSKFSFFRIKENPAPRDFDFEGIHFCIE